MPDNLTATERSRTMASVSSEHTKPEINVRKLLHASGFRFSLHSRLLPGKPDIILKRYNTVIFVNGCFWHGHQCKRFRIPGSNTEYWKAKIEKTILRDTINTKSLESAGWIVEVVWECNLKKGCQTVIDRLMAQRRDAIEIESRSNKSF